MTEDEIEEQISAESDAPVKPRFSSELGVKRSMTGWQKFGRVVGTVACIGSLGFGFIFGKSGGVDLWKSFYKSRFRNFIKEINKVPVEKINSFNVENHEGCVALRGKIKYQDLQQVISFVVESGEVPLFLILDGITDIRNIGAVARTAYCCGVQAIIIPDKGK